jgi:hypothetical protein
VPIDHLLLASKLLGLAAAGGLILFFIFPRKFFFAPRPVPLTFILLMSESSPSMSWSTSSPIAPLMLTSVICCPLCWDFPLFSGTAPSGWASCC